MWCALPDYITGEKMESLSQNDVKNIKDLLCKVDLGVGIGTVHNPCSIAAINLALSGRLTDEIPECMSSIIGMWIIEIQDAMPDHIRNSAQWKELLPLAAGTKATDEVEKKRLDALFEWFFSLMPEANEVADHHGFREDWDKLVQNKNRVFERANSRSSILGSLLVAVSVPFSTRNNPKIHASEIAYAIGRFIEIIASNHPRCFSGPRCFSDASEIELRNKLWEKADPAGMLKRLIEIQ